MRAYQDEVANHYRKLRTYANEVDEYYEDAADYVRCMSNLG